MFVLVLYCNVLSSLFKSIQKDYWCEVESTCYLRERKTICVNCVQFKHHFFCPLPTLHFLCVFFSFALFNAIETHTNYHLDLLRIGWQSVGKCSQVFCKQDVDGVHTIEICVVVVFKCGCWRAVQRNCTNKIRIERQIISVSLAMVLCGSCQ